MAAPVIESHQETQQSTATSVSAAPASGIVDDNLILAINGLADSTATIPAITYPDGNWALGADFRLSNRFLLDASRKIASGESGNYSFGADATMDFLTSILRISGANNASWLNVSGEAGTTAALNHDCPSVDTTVEDCLILYIIQHATGTGFSAVPASSTLLFNFTMAGETSSRLACYWKNQAAIGATGIGRYSTGTTKGCGMLTLAIPPALVSAGYQFRGAYL